MTKINNEDQKKAISDYARTDQGRKFYELLASAFMAVDESDQGSGYVFDYHIEILEELQMELPKYIEKIKTIIKEI